MTVLVDAKPWPDWPEGFPHGAISGRVSAGLAEHSQQVASDRMLFVAAGLAGGVAALLFERFLDRVVRGA